MYDVGNGERSAKDNPHETPHRVPGLRQAVRP